MEIETENKINEVLGSLPGDGETAFPDNSYEQGIEEAFLYLLGGISREEFPYATR